MARPGPRSYDYKQPRRLNVVTIGLLLLVAAAVYGGVKFGPAYHKRYKIDHLLDEARVQAGDFYRLGPDQLAGEKRRVHDELVEKIEALGVTEADHELQVYFGQVNESINADWVVTVKHPIGKPTVLRFHREVALPQEGGGLD